MIERGARGDGEARGLFARCAIPAGTWIGDFAGLVKTQRPGDSSRYLLEIWRDPDVPDMRLDVDAQLYGNETRFINDYHGVADAPNISFTVYRHTWTGELAVGCLTLESVKCGAELLADYGQAFWSAEPAEPKAHKASPPSPLPCVPTQAAAPCATPAAAAELREAPAKEAARPASVPLPSTASVEMSPQVERSSSAPTHLA